MCTNLYVIGQIFVKNTSILCVQLYVFYINYCLHNAILIFYENTVK